MVTAYFTTRHVYTSALRVVGMLRPSGGGAPTPFSMQCHEPGRHPWWDPNPRTAAVTGAGGRQSTVGPRVAERIPYPPVRPSDRAGRGSGSRIRPHRVYRPSAGPPRKARTGRPTATVPPDLRPVHRRARFGIAHHRGPSAAERAGDAAVKSSGVRMSGAPGKRVDRMVRADRSDPTAGSNPETRRADTAAAVTSAGGKAAAAVVRRQRMSGANAYVREERASAAGRAPRRERTSAANAAEMGRKRTAGANAEVRTERTAGANAEVRTERTAGANAEVRTERTAGANAEVRTERTAGANAEVRTERTAGANAEVRTERTAGANAEVRILHI